MNKVENKIVTIEKAVLTYLKTEFPYDKMDWVHPTTGKVWSNDLIKEKVLRLKELCPDNYEVLYRMWVNNGSRSNIAQNTNCSITLINKKLRQAVQTILLLLIYPELDIDLLNKKM